MDQRGAGRPVSSVAAAAGLVALLLAAGALLLVHPAGHREPAPPPTPALSAPPPTASEPALPRGWRQETVLDTGLADARGIAASPLGVVVVAGDKSLVVLQPGQAPRTLAALDAEPVCLAVDGERGWVVGLRDGVRLLDPQGRETGRWAVGGRRVWLTSVAPDADAVWVADAGDRVVLRYERRGTLLARLGEKDAVTGSPGLLAPSPHLDVVVAGPRDLWVTNPGRRQVEHYTTADGWQTWKLAQAWGKAGANLAGFCGCCNPTDLARLPDGKVVTAEKGLPRIKVYTPQGALESVVALPEDLSRDVVGLDLATDAAGRIYVLDPRARQVRVFGRVR